MWHLGLFNNAQRAILNKVQLVIKINPRDLLQRTPKTNNHCWPKSPECWSIECAESVELQLEFRPKNIEVKHQKDSIKTYWWNSLLKQKIAPSLTVLNLWDGSWARRCSFELDTRAFPVNFDFLDPSGRWGFAWSCVCNVLKSKTTWTFGFNFFLQQIQTRYCFFFMVRQVEGQVFGAHFL